MTLLIWGHSLFTAAPHIIPYQGSKRKLAQDILAYFPREIECLYEPFAGSAAISLAAMANRMVSTCVLADKLAPLAVLWNMIVDQPEVVVGTYSRYWSAQLEDPTGYFHAIRDHFNESGDPVALLYLIARCVKNAVRFNSKGEFNQAPDRRRLGMHPDKLAREVVAASRLLKGKSRIECGDFCDVLLGATSRDLIYLDPPWQGTSGKRDPRYAYLLDLDVLVGELDRLNSRGVPFLLSFDGSCGGRSYGEDLPRRLGLRQVFLEAGRSSQATLLGRDESTIESLYLSPTIPLHSGSAVLRQRSVQVELFG